MKHILGRSRAQADQQVKATMESLEAGWGMPEWQAVCGLTAAAPHFKKQTCFIQADNSLCVCRRQPGARTEFLL